MLARGYSLEKVETEEVSVDEMWSFVQKKQKWSLSFAEVQCVSDELEKGDCWIAISLASNSGLILSARVGKHTDELLEELLVSTEGKTESKEWNSDNWGGYERAKYRLEKVKKVAKVDKKRVS